MHYHELFSMMSLLSHGVAVDRDRQGPAAAQWGGSESMASAAGGIDPVSLSCVQGPRLWTKSLKTPSDLMVHCGLSMFIMVQYCSLWFIDKHLMVHYGLSMFIMFPLNNDLNVGSLEGHEGFSGTPICVWDPICSFACEEVYQFLPIFLFVFVNEYLRMPRRIEGFWFF